MLSEFFCGVERFSRYLAILLFIVSGLSHWENPLRFLDTIYSYKIIFGWSGSLVAMLLPLLQLQIAYCFFIDAYRLVAWMWSAGIFGLIVMAQGAVVYRGLNVQCGCFGEVAHLDVGIRSLVMASALFALSMLCCGITALVGENRLERSGRSGRRLSKRLVKVWSALAHAAQHQGPKGDDWMTESGAPSPPVLRSLALKRLDIVTVIAAVLAVGAVAWNVLAAYGPPAGRPAVTCAEAEWNFGVLEEQETIEHTFTLRNAGWRALTISSIASPCPCIEVSPMAVPQTVAQGESLAVVSRVDPKRISGRFRKALSVKSNDPRQPVFKLVIRGEIRRPRSTPTMKTPAPIESSTPTESGVPDGAPAPEDAEP